MKSNSKDTNEKTLPFLKAMVHYIITLAQRTWLKSFRQQLTGAIAFSGHCFHLVVRIICQLLHCALHLPHHQDWLAKITCFCLYLNPSKTNKFVNLNPQNVPTLWPSTTREVHWTEFVIKDSIRAKGDYFLLDDNGCRFSAYHYTKILTNDEKLDRHWMIYSQTKNVVNCFACRFRFGNARLGLNEGVGNRKRLGDYVNFH